MNTHIKQALAGAMIGFGIGLALVAIKRVINS